MAANDRHAADQGRARALAYPVSLQQAAAAIFGITPQREQFGGVPSRPLIQSKKTGKIREN